MDLACLEIRCKASSVKRVWTGATLVLTIRVCHQHHNPNTHTAAQLSFSCLCGVSIRSILHLITKLPEMLIKNSLGGITGGIVLRCSWAAVSGQWPVCAWRGTSAACAYTGQKGQPHWIHRTERRYSKTQRAVGESATEISPRRKGVTSVVSYFSAVNGLAVHCESTFKKPHGNQDLTGKMGPSHSMTGGF